MANSKWQKIDEIFPQVADLPADERERRLSELCGTDESLRREIASLLAVEAKAENFIESPVNLPESLSRVFSKFDTENRTTLKLSGEKIGAYKIVRKLGAGGMGAVYLAVRDDGEFEKKVAIKLVKNGADTDFNLNRFRRERQILATLEHPFIARLIDGGTLENNLPYLVMEYVGGESVFDYCNSQKLDLNGRLKIFRQICEAVEYAHERRIIHRDIKPGNILVSENGAVKLLDFGIAKILDADFIGERIEQTATLMRQLTPEYAAPEQIKGGEITEATDIYSLGIVLYEMLTGTRPYKFPSRSAYEIARVICEEKVRVPKFKFQISNSDDLSFIVLKALNKNPSERYASIADFDRDIERFTNGLPVLTEGTRLKFFENSVSKTDETGVSLAIAPFQILQTENRPKDDADNSADFLSIGLADALTTKLSGVRQINVRPTSSVLRLVKEGASSSDLGAKLGADYVLEGNILRSGEQIRVSVQLLKTRDEKILWAEQFDESCADVFRLQDLICERVAESLVPHLTTEEQEILRRHGTNDAAAYEAYLRGRVAYHTYTFDGIARSGSFFEAAIERDPDFAPAHSGLADFYNWQTVAGLISNKEGFTKAKRSANKAIELDPNLSEAHASLAFAIWAFDWDFAQAERLFTKAIRLNPNNVKAHEWYSYLLSSDARHDEAIEEMRRAERLDPNSPSVAAMFGFCFYNARRYEEGLEKTRRSLELAPDYYLALQGLGWVCPPLGLFEEAIEGCRRAVSISDVMCFNKFSLALALIAAGETAEAREIALEIENKKQKNGNVPAFFLAEIYANLDEFDLAFKWLDRAIEERGYWTIWTRVEPRFDKLRENECFAARLAKIKPTNDAKITEDFAVPTTGEMTHSHDFSEPKRKNFWLFTAAGAAILLIFAVVFFNSFQNSQKSVETISGEKTESQSAALQNDERATESSLSKDAAANDFYRAGRQQLATRTPDGIGKAVEFFSEATKRDPDFALAFSGLADAQIILAGQNKNTKDEYERAEEFAVKALALEPDLAEARVSLAMAKFKNTGDFAAAEKHFLRAIEINPKLATAHHWYSIVLNTVGNHEKALREMKIAAEIEPESAIIQYALGSRYLENENFDEALKAFNKAIENNNSYIQAYVAKTYIQQSRGDYDAALETYRTARIYNGADENEPLWLIMQAQTFAAHGKNTEAENVLNRYFKTADYNKNPLAHALDVALVYNLMNDAYNTFQWLQKVEQTPEKEFMKKDLRFKNLYEDKRFAAIYK